MKILKWFRSGWLAFTLVGLVACQTPPQTQQLLQQNNPSVATRYQIDGVPFFKQEAYYCGPTTLAEVANFYGHSVSPSQLAQNTFVPELAGSLQTEMNATVRQLGMLAYNERGTLKRLIKLVNQDKPVIVLQNNGLENFPNWHYALVIGYDLKTGEIILHSGEEQNYRLSIATFERTWQRADYWMLVALPPEQSDKMLDPFKFVSAAQDLIATGQQGAGRQALQSATQTWPDAWLGYFLLANDYLKTEPDKALTWYEKGFRAGQQEVAYLNNYAHALAKAYCFDQAEKMLIQALKLSPNDPVVMDSRAELSYAKKEAVLIQHCPLHDKF
ncbi:PA2778 family cysteine peptidase [Gayadomonas joobiniege]|uniref:PA2778 family cysteine peptidase n=1 Tax=Gayadomonas joobiniege TaxID=1234606 RepID=UPI00036A64B8|nr:PA2778 family cysteine peptidase [Gayadomonas joobiniege]